MSRHRETVQRDKKKLASFSWKLLLVFSPFDSKRLLKVIKIVSCQNCVN